MHATYEDEALAAALLAELDAHRATACAGCARPVCGHEVLFSVALGAKDAPRCAGCLAATLGRDVGDLRDDLVEHFRHRACYSRAWAAACEREGQPRTFAPPCLGGGGTRRVTVSEESAAFDSIDDAWDAGDMACGELVLALRIRLNGLPAGSVLQVTALDPAAPLDLPAWCRLTGHRLVREIHPNYWIRRKEV